MNKRIIIRLYLLLTALVLAASVFCRVKARAEIPSVSGQAPFHTEDPLEMDRPENTIGIVTGAGSETLVRKLFHKAEIKSYKGPTELILGLERGQVDAIVYNGIVLENAQREKPDKLYILKTPVGTDEICMTVSPKTKIKSLHSEVTEFMEAKKEQGYLDDLYDRWTSGNGYVMPDIPEAQQPRAVITTGTQGTIVPYSFYQGDELIGMCVELVRTFALEYGYAVDFRVEDTTSQLSDAEFGRIDMTDGGFFYTEERAEQADFVFPAIHEVPTEMMVLAQNAGPSSTFLDTMRVNFEKTFIRESRWKLILDGLRVTLLLSCCSLVLGTILACLFCAAAGSRFRAVSLFMKSVIELVNGMPIVLFLMICFYVIFARTGLPEMIVAIIAFATDFGCRGAVTLDSGIRSVEKGEIVTLIGANGAGKSTTLRAISGLVPLKEGTITYDGQVISGQTPQKTVSEGIGMVPEGRRVFPNLTVLENLKIGAYLRKDDLTPDIEHVYQMFPRLQERSWQLAGTLSGGEQQMLAVGRAMMMRPKLLMMD